MQRTLIREIHTYVARYSVSASAVRGRRAPGLVAAARSHLATLPLRAFAVRSHRRFQRQLDAHTATLIAALPRAARSWGVARKVLNIFLRNALYTSYLRDRYHLGAAEAFYEIPLDSIVADRLRLESEGAHLPRWKGVKHLSPEMSREYQDAARSVAERLRVAPVHLDAVWWGGLRRGITRS